MSIKVMTTVWDESKQKGSKLLLMLALADFADDSGFCWPSEETLAEKTRLSSRHVRRMANELQDAGELYIKSGLSKGRSNRYVIMINLPEEKFEQVLRVKLKTPKAEIKQLVARYYGDNNDSPVDELPPDSPGGGSDKLSDLYAGGVGQLVRGVGLMSPTGRTHESDEPSLTVKEPPAAEELPPPPKLKPKQQGGDSSPQGGGDQIKELKHLFSNLTGIKPGKRDHGRWSKDAKDLIAQFGPEAPRLMRLAWQQLAGPKVQKGQIVIAAPGSLRSFMQQVAAQRAANGAAIDPAARAAVEEMEAKHRQQLAAQAAEAAKNGPASPEQIAALRAKFERNRQQFLAT